MPVIAIEGRVGSYAPDVGRLVARELKIDFVDRLLLAEVARRAGSTVQAVAETEARPSRLVDRLARLVQRMLERSAVAGGGDPYFGPGVETMLSRPYRELDDPAAAYPGELSEQKFIDTTAEVIRDVAEDGSVVILSRGAAAILRGNENVLRVGLVADREDRVRRIMEREQLDIDAARDFVEHSDHAQGRYFEKAFESSPIDPFLYHAMINTSGVSIENSVNLITGLARTMRAEGLD